MRPALRRQDRAVELSPLHAMLVGLIRGSGRTQTELAAATGITQKHMSYLMTGRAEGSLSLWSDLLAAADVHLPEMVIRPGISDGGQS